MNDSSTPFTPGTLFCSKKKERRPTNSNSFVPRYLRKAMEYIESEYNVPALQSFTYEGGIAVRGKLECDICKRKGKYFSMLTFGKANSPEYCFKVTGMTGIGKKEEHSHTADELQMWRRKSKKNQRATGHQTDEEPEPEPALPEASGGGSSDEFIFGNLGEDDLAYLLGQIGGETVHQTDERKPPAVNVNNQRAVASVDEAARGSDGETTHAQKKSRMKPRFDEPEKPDTLIGLDDLLETLVVQLDGDLRRFVTLIGSPGTGKTSIARHVCYHWYKRNPDSRLVYWISVDGHNCSGKVCVKNGYMKILKKYFGKDMDNLQDLSMNELAEKFVNELKAYPDEYECMLVLDDVPEVSGDVSLPWFLAGLVDNFPDNGRILLTTKRTAIGWPTFFFSETSDVAFEQIEVKAIKNKQAASLLLESAGISADQCPKGEQEAAEKVSFELEGNQLAINVAGRYIKVFRENRDSAFSILTYWKVWSDSLSGTKTNAVQTVLKESLRFARELDRGAAALLDILSYMSPNDIPKELVSTGDESSASVNLLRDLGLLSLDESSSTYSMNQMLQEAVIEQHIQDQQHGYSTGVQALAEAFDADFSFYNSTTWATGRQWLRHAEALIRNMDRVEKVLHSPMPQDTVFAYSRVLKQCGRVHEVYHEYEEAEEKYSSRLKIHNGMEDPKNSQVSCDAHSSLGFLYRKMSGRKEDSLKHSKTSLEMAQKLYGEESVEVAMCKKNIALALKDGDKEELQQALGLLEDAMQILDKSNSRNKEDKKSYVYNNKGLVHMKLSEWDEAIQCFEQSCKYGDAHGRAYDLGNIARCYWRKDQRKVAQEYAKQSEQLLVGIYGSEASNPDVSWINDLLNDCTIDEGKKDSTCSQVSKTS